MDVLVSAADATPTPSPCKAPFLTFPRSPWDGGHKFDRLSDFLDYFRLEAMHASLVVPAHGVDCTMDAGIATCNYDPRSPRLDSSDVHFSDATQEFVGPDGRHTIWSYFASWNAWLVGTSEFNPATYALLLERNTHSCPP
jgi:hypothetical protein